MAVSETKIISVGLVLEKIISSNYINKEVYILSHKINIPKNSKICGNELIFKNLILDLIRQAKKSYLDKMTNKIILLIGKIENEKEISISVTDGGEGLSFISKKLLKQSILLMGDGTKEFDIQQINKKIKKEFNGRLELFSKKNKGTTIKCFFPMNI